MNLSELITILSAMAIAFGAYLWLDEKHADRHEQTSIELDIRQEILDRDIDRNAKVRVYYDQLEQERPLNKAEASRKKYVVEQLDRQYAEQQSLADAKQRLKEQ